MKLPLHKRHIIILVRGEIQFCSYASKVVDNKTDSLLTEAWRNFAIYWRLLNVKNTRFVSMKCLPSHRSLFLAGFTYGKTRRGVFTWIRDRCLCKNRKNTLYHKILSRKSLLHSVNSAQGLQTITGTVHVTK